MAIPHSRISRNKYVMNNRNKKLPLEKHYSKIKYRQESLINAKNW